MLQRLAVTNPKNDKMDPHGVNPTLSIFLPTQTQIDNTLFESPIPVFHLVKTMNSRQDNLAYHF
jgi:hypothetical protein